MLPPPATVLRAALLAAAGYAAAVLWPTPGPWVIVKLPLLALATLVGFGLLGEFTGAELTAARSLLRRRARAA